MGTAHVQGPLWGARARDYASIVEGFFRPLYERVFDEADVGMGTRLLDVGCGTGLATQLAAARGARVAGLDGAEASLAIARERVPGGDFRLDEMEALPWPGDTFDVVTGFNSFFFAADLVNALREARRVARPGGRVAMTVWGPDGECDTTITMAAIRQLLPPQPPGAQAAVPLSTPGRVEVVREEAGLAPLTAGEVDCPFEFPDLETAARGLMSAGATVAVVQRVGAEPVQRAIAESLARFRTDAGGYRQRNKYRFVIAAT